jgi:hypothetical protein
MEQMDPKYQQQPSPQDGPQVDLTHLILIVVGAHLRAEVADRPLAYRLRDVINQWVLIRASGSNIKPSPLVCSDVWYVNQPTLQQRPVISLGGPGINVLSAFFAKKLVNARVPDQNIVIQLDPEFVDLRACVWGMNHHWTVKALDLFVQQHLDDYLRAVVTQVVPREE